MLEQIIPAFGSSPGAHRATTLAVWLFPAALAAGFVLLVRNAPPTPVPITVDGDTAISLARDYAIRHSIPAQNWTSTLGISTDNNLLDFVNGAPSRVRLWQIAPPIQGTVTLVGPKGDESVKVAVGVDGKVLGFDWKNAPDGDRDLSDDEARALAAHVLPAGFAFGEPTLEKPGQSKGKTERTLTAHSAAAPDLDIKSTVRLKGDRVVAVTFSAEAREGVNAGSSQALQTGLGIAGGCFLCLVSLFSIFRYANRTLQQEVSHRRTLIITILSAIFFLGIGFNAVVNSGSQGQSLPLPLIVCIFMLLGLFAGALLGAAYGSGEGDIREAWPGKLTSLDALLGGRLFSRNVGISLFAGAVFASWMTLALGLAGAPFRSAAAEGSASMGGPFMRLTWLISIVSLPLISLAAGAAALLQPLAFLQRYLSRFRRLHIPALALCGLLVFALRSHSRSNIEFLISSGIFAAALLTPFFMVDLLASLTCITGVVAATTVGASYAIAPSLSTVTVASHGIAGAGAVLFALVCLKWAPLLTEEQVRPLYAKHIAERQSLEAEVSAAREAQLRLLPESVPEFAGLNIAAACVPAEVVGGDFYDFFPLADGMLGIFIAEGNNRGLAAALTIALAKGYLMHAAERCFDPVELLSRMEVALAAFLDTGTGAEVTECAFAAVDTRRGEVRYARTGVYPKVVVTSTADTEPAERLVPVKGRRSPIAEGSARFAPGDRLMLFTDGLGRRLASSGKHPEEVARGLAAQESRDAERLRERLFSHSKADTEPDDLTAVVIHALETMSAAEPVEAVA